MTALPVEALPRIGPKEAFDAQVRRLFREAIDQGMTGRVEIAEWIASQLTPDQCRQVLMLCLPLFLSQIERLTSRAEGKSKAERIQSWYAKQLDATVFVKDQPKFFGECTAADLHEIAQFRYGQARRLNREADAMVLIAKYMREHDKQRVGNLTEKELRSLMGVPS